MYVSTRTHKSSSHSLAHAFIRSVYNAVDALFIQFLAPSEPYFAGCVPTVWLTYSTFNELQCWLYMQCGHNVVNNVVNLVMCVCTYL